MRIKKILTQHRRDFIALYECEFCGHEQKEAGYDDDNFHQNVIPDKICPSCGKGKHPLYQPRATKYPAGEII